MSSKRNPGISIDLTKTEFVRPYGPKVVFWKLTALGKSRLDAELLPPNLPRAAYTLMAYLKELGVAEEDELADRLIYSLPALRKLLKRLVGYGYVEKGGE